MGKWTFSTVSEVMLILVIPKLLSPSAEIIERGGITSWSNACCFSYRLSSLEYQKHVKTNLKAPLVNVMTKIHKIYQGNMAVMLNSLSAYNFCPKIDFLTESKINSRFPFYLTASARFYVLNKTIFWRLFILHFDYFMNKSKDILHKSFFQNIIREGPFYAC